MLNLIILLFSTIQISSAEDDHCSYFKYCGSASTSTSAKSQPSTFSAANFNPSNISNVKGLGVETLIQPNNSLGFNLVTGTGKLGGAIISPSAENSFFGNRAVELDREYLVRREEKKRYKNKKINLALGANVYNKNDYGLDLGISLKRHPDIKHINFGAGLSARLGIVNLGAFIYKDDVRLQFASSDYNPESGNPYFFDYPSTTYTETFTAKTFSIGTQLGNLALDAGLIKTKYDFYPDETVINIYSSAYKFRKFLFNFAYRKEVSSNLKEKDGILFPEKTKLDYYGGVQYLVNKHLTLGLGYNNFLLHEWSMTVTLFL